MSPRQSLRGQARRTHRELVAAYLTAVRLAAEHVKGCGRCTMAGQDVFKRCDWGWELAKIELRALRAKERYDFNHPDAQERLF